MCKTTSCWSTNHTKQERIHAICKNRHIRQFVTDLLGNGETDETSKDVSDALEEIVTHMQTTGNPYDDDEVNNDTKDKPTASDPLAVFISQVLHCTTAHATSTRIPHLVAPKSFKGIMFDTGASRASSGSVGQFNAYCAFTGTKPTVDKEKEHWYALVFVKNSP